MNSEKLPDGAAKGKDIPEDAKRALEEAAERRRLEKAALDTRPKEINGPKGQEPTRHGEWERKGITYDF